MFSYNQLVSSNCSIEINDDKCIVLKHPVPNKTNTFEFDIHNIKAISFHRPSMITKGSIKFMFKTKIIDSNNNKLSNLQVPFETNDASEYHLLARKLSKELKVIVVLE